MHIEEHLKAYCLLLSSELAFLAKHLVQSSTATKFAKFHGFHWAFLVIPVRPKTPAFMQNFEKHSRNSQRPQMIKQLRHQSTNMWHFHEFFPISLYFQDGRTIKSHFYTCCRRLIAAKSAHSVINSKLNFDNTMNSSGFILLVLHNEGSINSLARDTSILAIF